VYAAGEGGNGFNGYNFADPADVVMPLDFDGDGRQDLLFYRPGKRAFWLNRSNGDGTFSVVYAAGEGGNGFNGYDFADAADKVVPLDIDGDGKQDLLFYRPGQGAFWVNRSNGDGTFSLLFASGGGGAGYGGYDFASTLDQVLPLDYDGDGKHDLAFYRPGQGAFWLNHGLGGTPDLMTYFQNEIGGGVFVSYAPAPQVAGAVNPRSGGPGIPNIAPRPLVTQIVKSDGRRGYYTTRYNYSDARIVPGAIPNRRDLGFAYIESIDNNTNQSTRTYYNQSPGCEWHAARIDSFDSAGRLMARAATTCSLVNPNPGTELALETRKFVLGYEAGTYASSQMITNTFDAFGNLEVEHRDADNLPTVTVTTTYSNDTANWVLGRVTAVKTTSGSRTLQETRNTWTNNTITAKSDWLDTTGTWLTTSLAYDANGNLVSVTEPAASDGLARTTTTEFDATFRAYPITVTNALGHVVRRTYNADGLLTSVTDPNGNIARSYYDTFGRIVSEIRPDGGSTSFARYNYGDVNSQFQQTTTWVDASRAIVKREYFDGTGFQYRVEMTGEAGQSICLDYSKDFTGRPSGSSMPHYCGTEGAWSRTTYDPAGRIASAISAEGLAVTYDYGVNYVKTTDSTGRVSFEYVDARGKTSSIIDAANQKTTYARDPLGRITSISLPDGSLPTQVAYDSLNRKTSVTDALGTTTYAYDAVGNAILVTSGGKIVAFTFDALNRVTSKRPGSEPAVSYSYDDPTLANGKGRLTQIVDASGASPIRLHIGG
jgi:YD repeat-containing protein